MKINRSNVYSYCLCAVLHTSEWLRGTSHSQAATWYPCSNIKPSGTVQADHYTNFFWSIQVHKHYFVHIWYELTKSTSKTGFPVNRSRRFIAVTVLHLSLLSQRRLQLNHTENYFPVQTTSHNSHSIFSALMLIATWCPCDFAHHSNEHVYLQLDAYGVAGLSSNNNTSVQSIPIKSILQLNVPTYERYVQWSHVSSHFYLWIYSCTNRHFTTNFLSVTTQNMAA